MGALTYQEVEGDEPVEHDLGGSGERASPMPRKNGQRTDPGCVLAHCSTRAMGHHKMVGKEEILSLEQKMITLASHSLL